ncbi:MutS-like ATPase involved in mismatch repair, family 1 [Clostridium sp. SY8519]|uniref:endonuclease MutS2 n=1 Tax=Clostridium sp. (strain SY8519) TaxID=1042156 RepID=UPI0002171EB4|nr:endonuclease MutS2 [Clostridium sp. SY8519]BAK47785.1 MutS-like ATPase involved in mismatch repair, family 1 [Clostridium sp. SY8519]
MNHKVYHTLEYDKIIQRLTEYATSDGGREMCQRLKPMTDLGRIRRGQTETADAFARLLKSGKLTFSGLKNPKASMKRLEIGGVLNTAELLAVSRLLRIAAKAKAYGKPEREDLPTDSLQELFDRLEPVPGLAEEIDRCILAEDEISDDASPKLRQIRRTINGMSERIHSALNRIVNSSAGRIYLQDPIVTMRSGRYCLPVKAEYKAQIPGMVHDQSSSGNTLFIEPVSVVKLNNELRETYLKEAEEIDVILARLSSDTAEYSAQIQEDFITCRLLDFIFAKGRYAQAINGMAPVFNTEGIIRIRRGRHPLLDPKKVVPIDVSLGEDYHVLVVTGPNTGGKTVSLKTVGLLTLMGQAGMHIPAADRSQLAVFDEVFADIGDEQSIEQSLSTFSSHITNMVSIFRQMNPNSLVLFDELCAGTDPNEGAALAISILDDLRSRGIRTMATTHYSEMKIYALSTEGVENASCEFDVETLSPTYRLVTGVPGKSNAFAISQRLGLPESLIDGARQRLSQEAESFEDVIADLEQSRHTIEQEQQQIARYKTEIETMKEELAESRNKLEARRDKLIAEANEEAAQILREAKEVADDTIRKFRKYGKNGLDAAAMEKDREKVRKQLDKANRNAVQKKKQKIENHQVPKKLMIGDSVKVLSMNLKGTVHTLPNEKGDLMVQMGILRYKVNIRDLVLINEDAPSKAQSRGTTMGRMKMSKSSQVRPEINLIGKKVDEALSLLDKYLDDAYLANMHNVRVVHGKGTGALRKAVHQYLKTQKHVKSYHLGEYGEGDTGVTIVEFK